MSKDARRIDPAITGKLRKRLILDLTVALGVALPSATDTGMYTRQHRGRNCSLLILALYVMYRYGVHVPSVARRDAFYAKLQSERSGVNSHHPTNGGTAVE